MYKSKIIKKKKKLVFGTFGVILDEKKLGNLSLLT